MMQTQTQVLTVKVLDRFENTLMHCEWALAKQLLLQGLARWHEALPGTIVLCRRDPDLPLSTPTIVPKPPLQTARQLQPA